jgi:hypothetical protein
MTKLVFALITFITTVIMTIIFSLAPVTGNATLQRGTTYDLSSQAAKLQNPGEWCPYAGAPATRRYRTVLLQVWAHPSASSVIINNRRASQPDYLEMTKNNVSSTIIAQGWVSRMTILRSQINRPMRVIVRGYYILADGSKSRWTLRRSIRFRNVIERRPLAWTPIFGDYGACNPRL